MELKQKTKLRLAIGFIFQVLLFMAIAPFGSFDPKSIGFWFSLFGAGFTTILIYFAFKKYAKYEK